MFETYQLSKVSPSNICFESPSGVCSQSLILAHPRETPWSDRHKGICQHKLKRLERYKCQLTVNKNIDPFLL